MTNFVTITGTPISSIPNHIKYIDLTRSTKYGLFNKANVQKELTECVDGIKWSSKEKKWDKKIY